MRSAFLLLLLASAIPTAAKERAIHETVTVHASLHEVWVAWTTERGITSFFAPAANIELRIDGPFEIFFNPYAEPGGKGADGMRVLAFQEETMISFTWNAPPHLPEARKQRTHVVIKLEPHGEGETSVELFHDGWGDGAEWDQAFDYFSKAWPRVLGQLAERFTQGPRDWKPWLEQLKKEGK
jgi:uncharacterized protein YndB with AHSA1/START domain